MAEHDTDIQWREWSDETFAEARAQDKPILLDIGAVWCHWCHVMDEGIPGDPIHTGTYTDPEVQARIAENFIPIKVDNDRRPDINARYNMGGWPTTAFLTPQGETLYGETYVPPPRMIALLDYIADVYQTQKDQVAEQAAQMRAARAESETPTAAQPLDPQTVPTVVAAIKKSFDFAYGGFGRQPKFPHPDALRLALEQYAATGDAELRTVAEKTLDGMAGGGMYDRYAGGFFRYSTTRDWSVPHFEKMLEDNARLTAVYALASQVLDPKYLEVVRSAQGWLLSDMCDAERGTFAGSQDADQEEAYYGEPLDVRATLPTPYIDHTVYAGWNALMVSALVARYRITGEAEILAAARKTFAFLEENMVGVVSPTGPDGTLFALQHYHTPDGLQGSLGLLADQTAFVSAALDLYEATAAPDALIRAGEAARYILLQLQDTDGGFFDLAPDPNALGELARPKKDMGENAEAALALIRLSAFTEEERYRRAAEQALQGFTGEYARQSYFASAYARAVEAAQRSALHIVIAGVPDDVRTQELQRAAWAVPLAGTAVETLPVTPGTRKGAADRGYPAGPDGAPRAYVCVGTSCQIADTPAALSALLRPSANAPA